MKSNYSKCNQPASLDFVTNGRNGWAHKKTRKEMKHDLADTHVSFPIFGSKYSLKYQSYAFVPIVPHPGVVHFTISNNWTNQAADIGKKAGETWLLCSVNTLLVIIVGFIIWAVVSLHSSVSIFYVCDIIPSVPKQYYGLGPGYEEIHFTCQTRG